MFEAHTLSATEFEFSQPALTVANQAVSTLDSAAVPPALQLIHRQYRCPLYVWFAEGKRKDKQHQVEQVWFIYVEYRRADQSHGCKVLEVTRGDYISSDIWQQLTSLTLADICPQSTRSNPILRNL